MQEPHPLTKFNGTVIEPPARNKNALKNSQHKSLLPERKKILSKTGRETQKGKMLVEECESGDGLHAKFSAYVYGSYIKAAVQKIPIYNYKGNYWASDKACW